MDMLLFDIQKLLTQLESGEIINTQQVYELLLRCLLEIKRLKHEKA